VRKLTSGLIPHITTAKHSAPRAVRNAFLSIRDLLLRFNLNRRGSFFTRAHARSPLILQCKMSGENIARIFLFWSFFRRIRLTGLFNLLYTKHHHEGARLRFIRRIISLFIKIYADVLSFYRHPYSRDCDSRVPGIEQPSCQ